MSRLAVKIMAIESYCVNVGVLSARLASFHHFYCKRPRLITVHFNNVHMYFNGVRVISSIDSNLTVVASEKTPKPQVL